MLNDADREALIMNASGAVNENWNVFKMIKSDNEKRNDDISDENEKNVIMTEKEIDNSKVMSDLNPDISVTAVDKIC